MRRLTALRRAQGLKQAELARRSGVHPTVISLAESGRLRPGPVPLARLCRALGVPAERPERLLEDVQSAEASA